MAKGTGLTEAGVARPRRLDLNDILNAPVRSMSDDDFFAMKASLGPALIPLGAPCHDCAVVCDFYSENSDRLALQPEPIRTEASLRWFCHNNPSRACRGNIDRIAGRAALAERGGAE